MGIQIKLSTLIYIYSVQNWFLYDNSSHKASKSMEFVFGDVQKHFDSTHLSRHSTISLWSLQNLIIVCLCKYLLNPSAVTKCLCLDTLECSHS